jgi:hypothetical protein
MGTMLARFSLLLACALVSACQQDYGDAPFACKSGVCPEGYQCVSQICRRQSAPPRDARVEKPWPPASDLYRDDQTTTWVPDLQVGLEDLARKEGIATFPDLPSGLTCAQIFDCYDKCAPKECFDACAALGSPDGKAKAAALRACDQNAASTTCYNACTYYPPATCYTCLDNACAAQVAACFPK